MSSNKTIQSSNIVSSVLPWYDANTSSEEGSSDEEDEEEDEEEDDALPTSHPTLIRQIGQLGPFSRNS